MDGAVHAKTKNMREPLDKAAVHITIEPKAIEKLGLSGVGISVQ